MWVFWDTPTSNLTILVLEPINLDGSFPWFYDSESPWMAGIPIVNQFTRNHGPEEFHYVSLCFTTWFCCFTINLTIGISWSPGARLPRASRAPTQRMALCRRRVSWRPPGPSRPGDAMGWWKMVDTTGLVNHRKTIGKPWEYHRKTIGKALEWWRVNPNSLLGWLGGYN